MIFNSLVNPIPIGADIQTVQDGDAPAHLVLQIHLGIPFPVGDNQIGILPLGELNIPMPKEDAEKYANRILEEAGKLPKTSGIIRATSIAEAEQLASQINQFGGKG